jgi:hypothetical protein
MTFNQSIAPINKVVELTKHLENGSKPMPVSPEMAQKFQAMMHGSKGVDATAMPSGHNVVGDMLARAQDDISAADKHLEQFASESANMDPAQVIAQATVIGGELNRESMKMTIATTMAEGSNKSLNSLLKNQ